MFGKKIAGFRTTPNPQRRSIWRSAVAAMAIGAGSGVARASEVVGETRHYWVHGSQILFSHEDTLEQTRLAGGTTQILGRSFVETRLQCGLPLNLSVVGGPLLVGALLLRIRCGGGALIQGIHLLDGEKEAAIQANLQCQCSDWTDIRLPFSPAIAVAHGIGLALDVAFDATGRTIEFSALGCEIVSA